MDRPFVIRFILKYYHISYHTTWCFKYLNIVIIFTAQLYAAFNRIKIASEGTIIVLIDYMKNKDNDIIGRQYCSMALGNLAAEPDNHLEIIRSEGNLLLFAVVSVHLMVTSFLMITFFHNLNVPTLNSNLTVLFYFCHFYAMLCGISVK